MKAKAPAKLVAAWLARLAAIEAQQQQLLDDTPYCQAAQHAEELEAYSAILTARIRDAKQRRRQINRELAKLRCALRRSPAAAKLFIPCEMSEERRKAQQRRLALIEAHRRYALLGRSDDPKP